MLELQQLREALRGPSLDIEHGRHLVRCTPEDVEAIYRHPDYNIGHEIVRLDYIGPCRLTGIYQAYIVHLRRF